MYIIPLVTIPHSGTHFMAAFFEEFKIVRHTTDWETLVQDEGRVVLDPRATTLIRGHIHPMTMPYITAYAEHWDPIVSMLEPLRQFVAYRNTSDTRIAQHLLPLWKLLIEEVHPLQPHYVPLDLIHGVDERSRRLRGVGYAAGLGGVPEFSDVVRRWAEEWPKDKHNAQKPYPLLVAYMNRDRPYIKREMPEDWEALVEAEDWLRPFLVERGYRDLLWWDE